MIQGLKEVPALDLVTPEVRLVTQGLHLVTLEVHLVTPGLHLVTLGVTLVTLGMTLVTPEVTLATSEDYSEIIQVHQMTLGIKGHLRSHPLSVDKEVLNLGRGPVNPLAMGKAVDLRLFSALMSVKPRSMVQANPPLAVRVASLHRIQRPSSHQVEQEEL